VRRPTSLRGKQDAARPLSCDKQDGASSLRSVTTGAGFDALQNAITVRLDARDTGAATDGARDAIGLKGASRFGRNPSYDVRNNRAWRSLLRAHSRAWRSLRCYCSASNARASREPRRTLAPRPQRASDPEAGRRSLAEREEERAAGAREDRRRLVEHVASTVDRHRAGEIDAYAVDETIHQDVRLVATARRAIQSPVHAPQGIDAALVAEYVWYRLSRRGRTRSRQLSQPASHCSRVPIL
jgi:hypothetical protein